MPHEAARQIGTVGEHGVEKGASGGIAAQLMRHFPDFGQEIAGTEPVFAPDDCLFPVMRRRQGGNVCKGAEGHVDTSKHSLNRRQTDHDGHVVPVRFAVTTGRRLLRFLIHALGMLAGVIILALAGLAWRLHEGPIVLGAATPWVMNMIERSVPGLSLEASGATLSGGDWRTTYGLSLSDVRILDKEDQVVFESRHIALVMSLPSLIEAELRPVGISFDEARIRFVRERDGNIRYALADLPIDVTQEVSFLDWFLHAGSRPPLDRLHHVRFDQADILLEDLGSGQSLHAPDSFLVVARIDESVRIDLKTVVVSEEGALPLELTAVHGHGTSRIDVSGTLMNLDVASLDGFMPALGDLSGAKLPFDTTFALAFDDELELEEGSFVVDTAGGHLALPGMFDNPVELGPTVLAGRLRPAFAGLDINRLAVGIGEGSLEATLTLNGWTDESTIEWTLAVADLPVDHLSRYWPVVVAPKARNWFTGHVSNGILRRGAMTMRSTLGDLASDDPSTSGLEIAADVDGITIDYQSGMPPLADVDSEIALIADTVTIETSGGTTGSITADRGRVTLDGFDGAMVVAIDLAGPVRDVLAVAAQQQLFASADERFAPAGITGSLNGTLEIALTGSPTDDGDVRFAGSFDDVGLSLSGYQVTAGNGTFSFGPPGLLDLNADLHVNGVPVAGRWQLALADDAEMRERLEIKARVNESQRDALGLVDPFMSTGSIDVTASRSVTGNGVATWHVDADLLDLAFGADDFPGAKSSGEPGSIRLVATENDGTVDIRELNVEAGSIVARAAGIVAPHALHLDVERLTVGRTDVSGALEVSPDGVYSITIDSGSIDLVPLADERGTTTELPRLTIAGTVSRLWTADNRLVRNLVINADIDGNMFESLDAAGEIEGGSLVALQIWRVSPEERRFDYRAQDMGDALQLFAGLDNIDGGELAVSGRLDDSRNPPVRIGTVTTERFAVYDAPILAHLFAAASLPGLANLLNNDGLVFDATLLAFRQEGERLSVTDGRLFGQGIRILVDGDIFIDQQTLRLAGTMVPTNPLNTLFQDIPLLGDIIAGAEDGDGIFAFTFNVDGPVDDPDVRVNPLSILAPGILRKLFTDSLGDE